jgi:hypothetical protein
MAPTPIAWRAWRKKWLGADSPAYPALNLLVSAAALIAAIIALFLAASLTGLSNDVARSVAENDRAIASDGRCVDALIDMRGSLTTLASGYSIRPLDRESRLREWSHAKQTIDSVSVTCAAQIGSVAEVQSYYAQLVESIGEQYLGASSGDWKPCLTDRMHDLAGQLSLAILATEDSSNEIRAYVEAAPPCT